MEMLWMGIVLGLAIGFCCRWFDIPLPSPPNLMGALIVVAMTLGFVVTDHFLTKPDILHGSHEQNAEGM